MRKTLSFILLLAFQHLLFSQDQRLVDSLQTILKETKQDTARAEILYQLSRAYLSNNFDRAMEYTRQTLALSERIGYKKGIGNAYSSMGVIYEDKGEYSTAMEFFNKSLKIGEEIDDKKIIAGSYNSIGNVYLDKGNYPEALKNYFAALKINEIERNKTLQAGNYNNMGIIYYYQGNYPEALKNFFASLKMNEEIGDKKGIANNYINIGLIYERQGKYSEALKYCFTSLKIAVELGNKRHIARNYNNIGAIYRDQGNYPEALKNFFTALTIYEEVGEKYGIATSYLDIGSTYIKQKKNDEASQYLKKALSLSKEIGSSEIIKDSYNGLSTLDSAQGDFKKSLAHYKMHIIIRDSMLNHENTKKIMQIEVDKKEALAKAEQETKDALALKELQKQKLVRNGFIAGFAAVLLFAGVFYRQRIRISKEKRKSEELLLNILPYEVAEELKSTGAAKAKTYSMVSVMFTDFKDFTRVSSKVSAELLVNEIHHCYSAFDAILEKHKIEKIKTIGDAYMCASGLPVLNYTHAEDLINAAMEILKFIQERKKEKEAKREIAFELRIGIHTGPVVAGIVGVKKFAYDIWGDTVNIAARMEQNSEAGKINISGSTYELVKDKFNCIYRGKIEAKNKGEVEMYFVKG